MLVPLEVPRDLADGKHVSLGRPSMTITTRHSGTSSPCSAIIGSQIRLTRPQTLLRSNLRNARAVSYE